MTPDELDLAYTRLCEAMGRVGEAQAPLFLAMVSLALMSRQADVQSVLPLIERAEAACDGPAAADRQSAAPAFRIPDVDRPKPP